MFLSGLCDRERSDRKRTVSGSGDRVQAETVKASNNNNNIVAWAKDTGKRLRLSTYDMAGEKGWRPLVYADNYSGDAVFHDDKRIPGVMADARLISAAPDLLDACKAALSDDQPYIKKCRAALAKAKGEQT